MNKKVILILIPFTFFLLLWVHRQKVLERHTPTRLEAMRYEIETLNNPVSHPSMPTFSFENVRIRQVFSDVPNSQFVISSYVVKYPDDEQLCHKASFVTKNGWGRVYATSGSGGCTISEKQNISLFPSSLGVENYYILAGAMRREDAFFVKGVWQDGRIEIVPIVDETFLFAEPDSDNVVKWVVALDEHQVEISGTKTVNTDMDLALTDYDTFHRLDLHVGVVFAGTYQNQDVTCLQLTYVTLDNLEKMIRGELAMTGQKRCVEVEPTAIHSGVIGTEIAGNQIFSGIVYDPTATHIIVEWDDGLEQTIPLENGIYIVERPIFSSSRTLEVTEIITNTPSNP